MPGQREVWKYGLTFKTGSSLTFSFTPDIAATYSIGLAAIDKDGGYTWDFKEMTTASSDLTENNFSVTVNEGQAATNSGTFATANPVTLSASVGTVIPTSLDSLFNDTFDGDPIGYTHTSLSQWDVTSGNVDLLGPGLDNFYPGNGNYAEMDGTTNAIMQTKTTFNLTPGVYQLSFEIGNNPNGSGNGLHFSLGAALDDSIAATNTLTPVVRQFTVSSAVSAPL